MSTNPNDKDFHWLEALNELLAKAEREEWTGIKLRLDSLTELSNSWPTCACGELCARIPRDGSIPKDDRLRELGAQFNNTLFDATEQWHDREYAKIPDLITEAIVTFHEIEARTQVLLAQMP